MNAQPRRTEPQKHLNSSIGPVERSLRQRADVLDAKSAELRALADKAVADGLTTAGTPEYELLTIRPDMMRLVAAEFLELADEFHYQW